MCQTLFAFRHKKKLATLNTIGVLLTGVCMHIACTLETMCTICPPWYIYLASAIKKVTWKFCLKNVFLDIFRNGVTQNEGCCSWNWVVLTPPRTMLLLVSRIHGWKKLDYIGFRNSFITGLCSYLRISQLKLPATKQIFLFLKLCNIVFRFSKNMLFEFF